jgi:hypothetical protein
VEGGPYRDAIFRLVDALQINNIRVLRRILRLVDEFLIGWPDLPSEVQGRVLPTLVLYPAVFFKGVSSPPSLERLVKFDSLRHDAERAQNQDRGQENDRIAELLKLVGVVEQDSFEVEIARALVSGIPDDDAISKIIAGYLDHRDRLVLAEKIDEFFYALRWDPQTSREASLEQLRALEQDSELIDPNRMTRLAEIAAELGDRELGERMVRKWADGFMAHPPEMRDEPDEVFDRRGREYHPEIAAAFEQVRRAQNPLPTPIEAMLEMVKLHGYEQRQLL